MQRAPELPFGLAKHANVFLNDVAPEGVHRAWVKSAEVVVRSSRKGDPSSKFLWLVWCVSDGGNGYWLAPEYIDLGCLGSPERDKAIRRIGQLLRASGKEALAPMDATDADIRGLRARIEIEHRKHWAKDQVINWVVGYKVASLSLVDSWAQGGE